MYGFTGVASMLTLAHLNQYLIYLVLNIVKRHLLMIVT